MGKRKLNHQQRRRISAIQEDRRRRAQKQDEWEKNLDENELGPPQEGLVTAHFGQTLEVETEDRQRIRCFQRSNLPPLVTGDRVVWHAYQVEGGVITALRPRKSELMRPSFKGLLKPVAANVDQIMVVWTHSPETPLNLVDRYLVAAESTGIEPVLVLNKGDIMPSDHPYHQALEEYRQMGYKTILTNAKQPGGLDALLPMLKDKSTVFIGQSGVGKSSIIVELLNGVEIKVGSISTATGKGRHTTTTARLYHLAGGGILIDSPGVREFGLWHVDEQAVWQGFVEFSALTGACRFRDCKHQNDPGCALKQAIDSGEVLARRVESYHSIINSLQEYSETVRREDEW